MIISPIAKEISVKLNAAHVWLIDATHKAKKLNLPFTCIVSIIATNTTYTFAYAFILSKQAEDYMWLIGHLCDVFQHYRTDNNCNFITGPEPALMNVLEIMFPLQTVFSVAGTLIKISLRSKNVHLQPRSC